MISVNLVLSLLHKCIAHTLNLLVVIARCENLYCGGDLNWNRIVPGTIRSVIKGESPVIRSDGTFVRDYFYVEDAVLAYIMLAEKLAENRKLIGEIFNFSNEEPLSVIEIVERILRLMNSELKPVVLNKASNEIPKQYLSARKAREILGWKPSSSHNEGLILTINWYKKFFSGTYKT